MTGHYRHVLVDEFQDTNQLHWQIIARVAGEDPDSPVKGTKLMIVGDPQQSIYRFRQADPTVFERIIGLIQTGNEKTKRVKEPTAYDQHLEATGQRAVVQGASSKAQAAHPLTPALSPEAGERGSSFPLSPASGERVGVRGKRASVTEDLDLKHAQPEHTLAQSSPAQRAGEMKLLDNYRTDHPLPLKLMDHLSKVAFDSTDFEYQNLVGGKTSEPNYPPEVVYLVPPLNDEKAPAPVEATETGEQAEEKAEAIDTEQVRMVAAELVRQHQKNIPWGQMLILLRSRGAHLTNLENTLRQWKIPYQLIGGLGFWQRQEVRDLVSLANCLANASDELALFAVLRGPLIGLDDSELLFLSTLGGRRLLKGLQRAEHLLNGEDHWTDYEFDEPTRAVIRAAHAAIPPARLEAIRVAVNRLGYQGSWRQKVDRLPHAELLRSALDESGAWAVFAEGDEGDRCLANLRLLLDHVRHLEAERPAPLADTARRLKRLVDDAEKEEQAEIDVPADNAVQVMTVHKAKGLQAAVVTVIGLERKFPSDSPDLWLLDRFQHFDASHRDSDLAMKLHGLPIVRIRHPEKPLEKVQPLLHQALFQIEKKLMIAEEARIFHVAITRAEQVLILAGKAKFLKNACWQDWVHRAFGLEQDFQEGTWNVAGAQNLPVRIVRTVPNEREKAQAADGPAPGLDLRRLDESPQRHAIAATALPEMLKLYVKDRAEWEMTHVHKVKPRARKIAQALLGEEKTADPKLGSLVGTLVHRALELGDAYPADAKQARQWLRAQAAAIAETRLSDPDETNDPDETVRATHLEGAVSTAQSILKDVLPNNPFRGLLDAEGDAEVDFSLVIGNWTITGRYDRLIRGADGAWEIVDWKTDSAAVEKIVKKYHDQMKLYALALYRSLVVEKRPKAVVVHLAMTHDKKSERLEFPAGELEAYAEELAKRLPMFDVDGQIENNAVENLSNPL